MYKASKEIFFCYGHRLLNYAGKCKNLHGHNAKAEIMLASETLDDRHMVVDFDDIKAEVKTWLDETIDHKMVLSKDDPLLPVLRDHGVVCCVLETNPTAEALAKVIFDYAAGRGFPVVRVNVWETESSYATYERTYDALA
jgi:6-pyruvoyltetrahydropterin/6-carboxytetrahydropterin synthase